MVMLRAVATTLSVMVSGALLRGVRSWQAPSPEPSGPLNFIGLEAFGVGEGEDVGGRGLLSGWVTRWKRSARSALEHELELGLGVWRLGLWRRCRSCSRSSQEGPPWTVAVPDSVGGGDEVEHGGLMGDVAVAVEAAGEAGVAAHWADVDVGGEEGGLGIGFGEEGCGEERECDGSDEGLDHAGLLLWGGFRIDGLDEWRYVGVGDLFPPGK